MAEKRNGKTFGQLTGAQKQESAVLRSSFTSWEIYRLTPRTDCKECGYHSCMGFAEDVREDRARVNLCPYITQSLYWLEPRKNCAECGASPCAEFVKKVAEGSISTEACPYVVANEKPLTEEKAEDAAVGALSETAGQSGSLSSAAKAFMRELDKANKLIADEQLSADLDEIKSYVADIYGASGVTAGMQSRIRKFGNIYLPTVLKLLNRYIELDGRKVQSASVLDAKAQIAGLVADAKRAFSLLNEELFSQASVDTEAEIAAFRSLLAIDGLSGDEGMKIPSLDDEEKK